MKDFVFKIAFDVTSYYLSRAKYAIDLLSHAPLMNNKIVSTPIKINAMFTPSDGELLLDLSIYDQLVCSLAYLIVTHFDIALT